MHGLAQFRQALIARAEMGMLPVGAPEFREVGLNLGQVHLLAATSMGRSNKSAR